MDGDYVSWRPGTLELIVESVEIQGSNLLDLVSHVVHLRHPRLLKHRLPDRPPGFAKFFAILRHVNASRELVRDRQRWSEIYHGPATAQVHPYDNEDDEEEDGDNNDTGNGHEKLAAGDDDNNDDGDEMGMMRPRPEGMGRRHWESPPPLPLTSKRGTETAATMQTILNEIKDRQHLAPECM